MKSPPLRTAVHGCYALHGLVRRPSRQSVRGVACSLHARSSVVAGLALPLLTSCINGRTLEFHLTRSTKWPWQPQTCFGKEWTKFLGYIETIQCLACGFEQIGKGELWHALSVARAGRISTSFRVSATSTPRAVARTTAMEPSMRCAPRLICFRSSPKSRRRERRQVCVGRDNGCCSTTWDMGGTGAD
jgi:hypothetical protein